MLAFPCKTSSAILDPLGCAVTDRKNMGQPRRSPRNKGKRSSILDEGGQSKEAKNGIPAPAANQGKKKNTMKVKKSNTEVIGCYICGNSGFSNALIDCLKCSVMVAHQYCVVYHQELMRSILGIVGTVLHQQNPRNVKVR
ncbi:uncharacterized protein [Spinacia oleracea]|uniref:Uncharacterized protein isoform X2 n=1 Tax=Spinacia oleracea TaxID=3562 RepID=A0ABM3QKP9_SPIOL|nr:uncharacterized protein LOC130460629 isoform X2 [Spinacia oleracea]